MNDAVGTKQQKPKIWNPRAAALWSLLFSPLFGALVHARNWEVLGVPVKAKASMKWARGIGVALAIILFIIPLNIEGIGGLLRIIGIIMLFSWFYAQGLSQIKFVKEKYGNSYEKKDWLKPLLIGAGCLLGYLVLAVIISGFYE